ncbi:MULTISPECIES: hypothetical protein [Xenorhabdus]|uniref:hypothetical protein n=1 Tax=Xenorhabdus TaxID=626 RepID=UPI00064657B2|nr:MULTISPECIES: hypothetical protein [Xenorhabdus]MBC8943667.1 hypothetical protein [Xenorhabdus indica]
MKLRKKIETLIELNEDSKIAADKICKLFEKEMTGSMSGNGWLDEDELLEILEEIFGDDDDEDEELFS